MYIRFGHIPFDGKSKIWDGEECVGVEEGVAVYDAVIEGERISVSLPLPFKKDTIDTFYAIANYQNRPVFLVNGNVVGTGNDGEPLIRNVKIIRQIK